jgi:D-alanyl-D-alanine carboxypeptidase
MMFKANGLSGRLCRGLLWGAAVLALVATSSDPADARRRHRHSHAEKHRHHRVVATSRSDARYADIVVDINSGQVLHQSNPDSLRHPASLTKIMTLYLLFEQLEAGRLKLNSEMHVSPHAASQSPTKLGLAAGRTIAVEDAIKAIVTQSANDMAVVVAEAIGGDEDTFARLMTRKAHALGMTRTVYVNASGLPADEQLTTARDQALLGRAIQERFPIYYRYFATTVFRYHGRAMRNHNHLLGKVSGVDGIKTGYTHSSGFNLVTSVRRGNRHIVAVVLGGTSSGARDARMRGLIEENIQEASTRRTAPTVAEATETNVGRGKQRAPEAQRSLASDHSTTVRLEPAAAPPPKPGSADPIQPIPVKTINVRAGSTQTAALGPLVVPAPQSTVPPQWAARSHPPAPAAPPAPAPAVAQPAAPPVAAPAAEPAPLPPPAPRPGVLGTLPVRSAALAPVPETPPAPPPAIRPAAAASLVARGASPPAEHDAEPVATVPADTHGARGAQARGEWMIQVGAFPEEGQARERLRSAQSMAHSMLGNAEGFTEKVMKGSKELYRARFAGLDKESAEAACHYFKRNDIACMALKN